MVLSKASPSSSFQLFPAYCLPNSVLLPGCTWSKTLFVPRQFQLSACHAIAQCGLRTLWPIRGHFLSFICCSNLCLFFSLPNSCKILSSHLTFKILCRRRFTNTLSELFITLAICQVSHSYDRNDLTLALNNRILFPTKAFLFLQTAYSCTKALFALLI